LDGSTWIESKANFFVPVRVLSARYRTLFLVALQGAFEQGLKLEGDLSKLTLPHQMARLVAKLRRKKWVVFIQAPFSEPETVLQYQAHYINRIALTNDRILPRGFSRIRYYGALSNRNKKAFLLASCTLLKTEPVAAELPKSWQERFHMLTGRQADLCRRCNIGKFTVIEQLIGLRELRRQRAKLPRLPSITRGPP